MLITNKHLPGRHDQRKHGTQRYTGTDLLVWEAVTKGPTLGKVLAKYDDVVKHVSSYEDENMFIMLYDDHKFAYVLSIVAADDPEGKPIMKVKHMGNDIPDWDSLIAEEPESAAALNKTWNTIENIAKDSNCRFVHADLNSLPIELAAHRSYYGWAGGENNPIVSSFIKAADEFVGAKYDLRNRMTNDQVSEIYKFMQFYQTMGQIMDIRHPRYPKVRPFYEFMTSTGRKEAQKQGTLVAKIDMLKDVGTLNE